MAKLLEEGQEIAGLLVRSLDRAAELVSSFKQVAVDRSSDMRRSFDLGKTMTELLLTLKPMYQKTAFTLEVDLPSGLVMESFPGALSQVVTNFISNSLAHGFEGRTSGMMRLSIYAVNDEQLALRFEDNGIGIAPENLPKFSILSLPPNSAEAVQA